MKAGAATVRELAPTWPSRPDAGRVEWADWLPIAAGALLLYLPTCARLAETYWTRPEYAHGPIVLAIALWLGWRARAALVGDVAAPLCVAGGGLLAAGLSAYVVGRSQDIALLETGSQIPVAAGAVLLMSGTAALRRLWFAMFFLLFLVPLPGLIVDPLTGELKQHVSAVTEFLLYHAGYPIARSGVVLSIGTYQLLVADACSGLHSLVAMAAMGTLFIHLGNRGGVARKAALAASLLPIAFAANVLRVVVLAVVTYHFGDDAGRGFIHGFSGILTFAAGLLMLFAFDAGLAASARLRRAA